LRAGYAAGRSSSPDRDSLVQTVSRTRGIPHSARHAHAEDNRTPERERMDLVGILLLVAILRALAQPTIIIVDRIR